jgi:hypothetical protein
MRICDRLHVATWRPDFSSSEQVSPTWTRLRCDEREISDSIEWVEWLRNPVQVELCDACGHAGCASGGFVHVSRLGDFVLWTRPQLARGPSVLEPEADVWAELRTRGALAVRASAWNDLAAMEPELPFAQRFVRANHAAVADAWILGGSRPSPDGIVAFLREQLIAGDTLERVDAIDLVERTLATLTVDSTGAFEQTLLAPHTVGARIETLYFDGPAEGDWPAFAFAGEKIFIVLHRKHIAPVF